MKRLFNKTKKKLLYNNLRIPGCLGRIKGLLGKKNLSKEEALLLKGTSLIHTFFMAFPIDVIFIDRENVVIGYRKGLKPFRVCSAPRGTCSILEVAAGSIKEIDLEKGDIVEVK